MVFIFISLFALAACNNMGKEEVEKIKDLAKQDSIKAVQATQKDSLISAYLNDLNEIQENLDRIKQREKTITMKPAEAGSGESVVAQFKELDNWIVENDKKMNSLQARLKKLNNQNSQLESLVAHLTQEITERDQEISDLQAKLGRADDSLRFLTVRLNDSIMLIKKQRADIAVLNTVYYVSGTMKQLQEKGIIDKKGGFIGLGRVAELSTDPDNAVFTKINLNNLKGVKLNGKLRKFITTHPNKAYEVITDGKVDSIAITMPTTFWGESKYLVVAIK